MRMKIVAWACMLALCLLSVRIGFIMLVQGEQLSAAAVEQRTGRTEVGALRGFIYDRNMIPLTENNRSLVAVQDGKPVYGGGRYRAGGLLSHVIGYVSADGSGSGIEGAFDEILAETVENTVSYMKDVHNNVLEDTLKLHNTGGYSGIRLTVDYHIQQIAEAAMDAAGISGAVVVVDAKSGEIAAMASRPNFEQDRVAAYLDSENGELLNRAVSAYNAGSVFKIAVAAAALEERLSEEMTFVCTGALEIDGMEFVCHKAEGHGTLTLTEAVAYSCNCAFYQIGQLLGGAPLAYWARELGFGQKVLRVNGLSEQAGNMPALENAVPRTIANVSIGQGDVLVTPLQIADMLCTILNGGERLQLSLIKGIVDAQGDSADLKPVSLGRVLSVSTAQKLCSMLAEAVDYGTGTGAQPENMQVAGKTGSAQTGWMQNGELMTHGWFAGYFPRENPRYVCVVLAENGGTGSDSACPVFREISRQMKAFLPD